MTAMDGGAIPDPGIAAEAAGNARQLITCGYLDLDEVAEALVDMQEDFGGGDKPETLEYGQSLRIAEVAWRARLAEQATWPQRTDVDALEAAFDELEDSGIVASENFACCARCGHGEIRGEMDEDSRGYVFFHQQRTEAAVRDDLLYLCFGAAAAYDPVDVGREVVGRLRDEGLPVEWNEDPDTAILVKPILWRKRIG
jgi:hypothetical protein